MLGWKNNEACLVSVICTAFNQRPYIRKAIESLLMQNTEFRYEIIVHDDASTDGTREIIKEFYSRYPEIIRPIFQEENQFSKGGFKPAAYAAEFAVGQYVALCEGDDYWIDNSKLQIQVDALIQHPELDFSFHSAYRSIGGVLEHKPSWDYCFDRKFYADSILNCVGSFAPTASYVMRRKVIKRLPGWFYTVAPVGDFFLEMYGSERGGAFYVNRPMAVYRMQAKNSWSSVMRANFRLRIEHLFRMLKALQLLERDFPNYSDSFRRKESITYAELSNYGLQDRDIALFRISIEKSVELYSFFSIEQRLAYIFRFTPNLLFLFMRVKKLASYSFNITKSLLLRRAD